MSANEVEFKEWIGSLIQEKLKAQGINPEDMAKLVSANGAARERMRVEQEMFVRRLELLWDRYREIQT